MIDKRLLLVERFLEEADHYELSDYLGVSKRQLARLLKQWEAEGYIEYTAASGRGNKMNLKFKVDIEKEIFLEAVNQGSHLTVEDIQEYLKLPWHTSSRASIMKILTEAINIYEQSSANEVIMDYIYSIPALIHPHYTNDLAGAQVFNQVVSPLYKMNHDGNIERVLLRYYEWRDNELHLYLHKDIYFRDGVNLKSRHVADSLEMLQKQGRYREMVKEIEHIEICDDYHLIIQCQSPLQNLKFILSEPYSAIYRETDKGIVGTGPYYIKDYTSEMITLQCNQYYRQQPAIKTIYLLENREKAIAYFTRNYGESTVNTCYVCNEFIVFNPESHLNDELRAYLSHIIGNEVREKMSHLTTLYEWKNHNHSPSVVLHDPVHVKMLADEYTLMMVTYLKKHLEKYHIYIDIVEISHEDYLTTHLQQFDADIVWMTETYYQLQPYKTYNLLSHCKLKDYFLNTPEAQQFIETMKKNRDEAVKQGEHFIDQLIRQHYVLDLFEKKRRFILPERFIGIEVNGYGFIEYHKIVVRETY